MRIGAVNYLNSKPLVYGLAERTPADRLLFDLPSRLADSLAAGRLDVALIPSVELFRMPGCTIVSDACVACCGPVLSIKLYFRVPPAEVRSVALDEGSRTSSALTQILLQELCGVTPRTESLPIGCGPETTDTDAVLLIGDRAIQSSELSVGEYVGVWDLGERWTHWTGLPFVFSTWVARPGVDASALATVLGAVRDEALDHLAEIAAAEAAVLRIDTALATRYLCDSLHFTLGPEERLSLMRFYDLCALHGLAPTGLHHTLERSFADGCSTR
jgi:chorismate dehydratase